MTQSMMFFMVTVTYITISRVLGKTYLIDTIVDDNLPHFQTEDGEEYSEVDEPREDGEPTGYKELDGEVYSILL